MPFVRRQFLTATGGAALLAIVAVGGVAPASAVPIPPKPPGTKITVALPTEPAIDHLGTAPAESTSTGRRSRC